ncbi:MAG TPA: hypothetical protein VF162_01745 [Streptosporangiaceae bacterium]
MRHVTGFFLALAAAAALFFGGGWGIARFNDIFAAHGLRDAAAWTNMHNVLPLAALLGTGLFIGILVSVRRVSALAPGLPGLALIGWSALVILRGRTALSYIPMSGSHFAAGFSAMLSSGALMLVGAGLIIPLFMPSRWRGYQAEVEEYGDDDFAATSSTLGLVP